MPGKGNPANLAQNREYPPEVRRAWARHAAQVKAARNRQIRAQKEILREILSLRCDDETACEALRALGLDESFANAANLAVLRRAVHGDVEALRYVRDTIGEKPTESMNIGVSNTPVRALDMTKLSDAELEALADREEPESLEPPAPEEEE